MIVMTYLLLLLILKMYRVHTSFIIVCLKQLHSTHIAFSTAISSLSNPPLIPVTLHSGC